MALWRRGKTKAVVRRVETEPADEDPQARADREFEERKRASAAALVAKIVRDGCDGVGFSDGAGLTRDERLDRMFLRW